jgi:hypothetical protein
MSTLLMIEKHPINKNGNSHQVTINIDISFYSVNMNDTAHADCQRFLDREKP